MPIFTGRCLTLIYTDVAYDDEDRTAKAVAVGFDSWTSADVLRTWTAEVHEVAAYEPGQFYKRELPCLVALLNVVPVSIDVIIVDGHVWLDGRPGLGHHLYEALGRRIPVVGIAKNAFKDGVAIAVTRGESAKPLYVSAAGLDPEAAAAHVRSMHGPHRLPAMLQRVDALTKGR